MIIMINYSRFIKPQYQISLNHALIIRYFDEAQ